MKESQLSNIATMYKCIQRGTRLNKIFTKCQIIITITRDVENSSLQIIIIN